MTSGMTIPSPLHKILAYDVFKCIILNEHDRIPIQISLQFVGSISPIENKPGNWGNGFAPKRQQAITWTNDDPIHWRIYAAITIEKAYGLYSAILIFYLTIVV